MTQLARREALRSRTPSGSSRLNILSMRSVIRNPPTTLTVAQITAMKPRMLLSGAVIAARGHQRADQGDAGDGVGRRHQRRVQQRRHPADHLVADEAGQDEDVDLDDDRRFI